MKLFKIKKSKIDKNGLYANCNIKKGTKVIEYKGKVFEHQKGDWKDEFVLLTISSPLFLLAYSVFAEDEDIQAKIDLYFEKLQQMPWWMISLWVSVVAAIYGIKATELTKFKK